MRLLGAFASAGVIEYLGVGNKRTDPSEPVYSPIGSFVLI